MSPSAPERTDPADRPPAAEKKIEPLVEEALESGPPNLMTEADWAAMHRALDAASDFPLDRRRVRWRRTAGAD